jgi:Methylaspartate ammonia-lyase C-terminus
MRGFLPLSYPVSRVFPDLPGITHEYGTQESDTLEDIRLFAAEKAAHVVQIKTPDVGSILDTILAILACKDHGAGAYVGGSDRPSVDSTMAWKGREGARGLRPGYQLPPAAS